MSTTIRSDRLPAPQKAEFPFLRPAIEPGEIGRLGNYRIFKLLGSGGMGKVFLAEDLALKRDVALKVMCLPPGEDILNWRERFLREARSLAGVKHPNLVTVYQVGEDRGAVFLAMEFLEGEALDARLKREAPLDVAEVLRVAEEIAVGMAAIHERGLIHRDIKPANIWLASAATQDTEPLEDDGAEQPDAPVSQVKILDFGLVREVKADTQLTESGVVVGTPAYMSPEQVRGRPLDHRTDLFSFGCVLYAMCTGRGPFEAANPMAQAVALAADEPTRARKLNPAVPRALSDLIAELLAKDPDDRPASAAEVRARLRKIATGADEPDEEPAPRRSFLWQHAIKLVALVWLVAAVLVAVAFTRDKRPADSKEGGSQPAGSQVDYLSDLPKLEERVFPPPDGPQPPNLDKTVRVSGAVFPRGLFMHGAPGFRPAPFVSYSLDKKYTRFTTDVTLNDSASQWTGLIFAVIADGKEVWASGNLSAGQKATCNVDVTGVSVLRLEVRTMSPHQGAHGAWLDPRLTK